MKKSLRSLPVAFLISTVVSSGVVPGRWEKVAALEPGVRVVVRLVAGDRIEAAFEGLTDDGLTVTKDVGKTLPIPLSGISRVSLEERDGNTNGTLIGAAAGFGVGFGSMVAWERSATASGFRLAEENLTFAVLGGLVGAGAGALAGWAIDRSTKKETVLYTVP